jgi:hypothetical protein
LSGRGGFGTITIVIPHFLSFVSSWLVVLLIPKEKEKRTLTHLMTFVGLCPTETTNSYFLACVTVVWIDSFAAHTPPTLGLILYPAHVTVSAQVIGLLIRLVDGI